jgi:hypothetical protein
MVHQGIIVSRPATPVADSQDTPTASQLTDHLDNSQLARLRWDDIDRMTRPQHDRLIAIQPEQERVDVIP